MPIGFPLVWEHRSTAGTMPARRHARHGLRGTFCRLQDQITLSRDVGLMLGTKLEYNDFSTELQPSGRVAWAPRPGQTVWGAVSRAVRVPTPAQLQLPAPYAFLDLALTPRGRDLNRGRFLDGATPRHQFGLRGALDLARRIMLDGHLRRLSAIRRLPAVVSGGGFPGYHELDVRVGWIGPRNVELSIIGQNLLHRSHLEFGPPDARGAVERGVYAKAAWAF